jgi:hypothetical protein
VSGDDDGVVPLQAYLRARQERADSALIAMFADVLNRPLERRELTPEQQARRDARIAARRAWLASRHGERSWAAPAALGQEEHHLRLLRGREGHPGTPPRSDTG